jgi:hypothetical protein
MKLKRLVITIFLGVSFLFGKGQIGAKRSFSFLEIPNHAQVAGVGTANVSIVDSTGNMVWQNPAILQPGYDGRLGLTVSPYLAGILNSQLSYAHTFGKAGTFGAGLQYLNYGDFSGYDNTGNATSDFTAQDWVVRVSHSRTQGVFRYGASIKWAVSQIEAASQSALLVDMGVLFTHPEQALTAGLVIKNIGFYTQQVVGEERSLPFDVQLGGTFKPEFMPFRFSLTASRLYQFNLSYFEPVEEEDNGSFFDAADEEPGFFEKAFQHITVGTELLIGTNLRLMAGYNHLLRQSLRAEQVAGASGFTFGVKFQTRRFDIAYSRATYHIGGAGNFITTSIDLKSL